MQLNQHKKNRLKTTIPSAVIVLCVGINDFPIRSLGMSLIGHIVFFALAIVATLTPVHAQSAATGIAKNTGRDAKIARLTVDALCGQLTLDEVTAVMGKDFERRTDSEQMYQVCKYGDSKEKGAMKVRYFTLGSSRVKEEGFRKFVESDAKGKIIERDGLLVSHLRKNKFGTDSIWFKDRQGHALELQVNSGITEDQAVALAKAAMD